MPFGPGENNEPKSLSERRNKNERNWKTIGKWRIKRIYNPFAVGQWIPSPNYSSILSGCFSLFFFFFFVIFISHDQNNQRAVEYTQTEAALQRRQSMKVIKLHIEIVALSTTEAISTRSIRIRSFRMLYIIKVSNDVPRNSIFFDYSQTNGWAKRGKKNTAWKEVARRCVILQQRYCGTHPSA